MELKERLLEFIKVSGLTTKAFEERCGMSNGYVSSIRKGLGREKLENVLLQFPNLNRDWLLYGEGEMLAPQNITATHSTVVGSNIQGSGNHITHNELSENELAGVIKGFQDLLRKKDEQMDKLIDYITKPNNK